ncbi:MAG: bifunctional demethylmenaquinone methyltransferase/2-methoxy-6-polyprenyl-1,4-benzoquinol methylase UbiE [Bacteroidales bacterium]|nr:bifunctional demethylmenaquinone methyltransferase/2-methoxy-6-polyprenyl-1,4-benzoquinol methylase UbiE [Bacteroidales bacterium]
MKNIDKSKDKISNMFNNIAKHYDFVGHLLSFGIDIGWRKKTIHSLEITTQTRCLDIATGTGDLAIALAKQNPLSIDAFDISEGMLAIAQKKAKKKNLLKKINFVYADAEAIPFPDNYFDIITIGFGTRNFFDYKKALFEIHRVLKKGGQLRILELTLPENKFGKLYFFYLYKVLPFIADKITHAHFYKYLPESIHDFDQGMVFMNQLEKSGFGKGQINRYSYGITTLYAVEKCTVPSGVKEVVKDLKRDVKIYNNAV